MVVEVGPIVSDRRVLRSKEAVVPKFFACARSGHIMPYHGRLRLVVLRCDRRGLDNRD